MIMIRTGRLKSKMKRIKMNFKTINLLILILGAVRVCVSLGSCVLQ